MTLISTLTKKIVIYRFSFVTVLLFTYASKATVTIWSHGCQKCYEDQLIVSRSLKRRTFYISIINRIWYSHWLHMQLQVKRRHCVSVHRVPLSACLRVIWDLCVSNGPIGLTVNSPLRGPYHWLIVSNECSATELTVYLCVCLWQENDF